MQDILGNDLPPPAYEVKTRAKTKEATAPRCSARNK